ncbi:hypothetical protein ACJX0J_024016, partial [Zea mays]
SKCFLSRGNAQLHLRCGDILPPARGSAIGFFINAYIYRKMGVFKPSGLLEVKVFSIIAIKKNDIYYCYMLAATAFFASEAYFGLLLSFYIHDTNVVRLDKEYTIPSLEMNEFQLHKMIVEIKAIMIAFNDVCGYIGMRDLAKWAITNHQAFQNDKGQAVKKVEEEVAEDEFSLQCAFWGYYCRKRDSPNKDAIEGIVLDDGTSTFSLVYKSLDDLSIFLKEKVENAKREIASDEKDRHQKITPLMNVEKWRRSKELDGA